MEGSSSGGVRKGAWSKVEDDLLEACIKEHGEGKWYLVPQRAGLNRCRKSCRLRWLNYLKPNIKRGEFSKDEVDLIIRLHKLLGNRWSLIAGRLPGRTSNDVKNYYNTYIRNQKKEKNVKQGEQENVKPHEVIKPLPQTLSKSSSYLQEKFISLNDISSIVDISEIGASSSSANWWETLLDDNGDNEDNNITFSILSEADLEGELTTNYWDQEFNSSKPIKDSDFCGQGQTLDDVLLDMNLWDNCLSNDED